MYTVGRDPKSSPARRPLRVPHSSASSAPLGASADVAGNRCKNTKTWRSNKSRHAHVNGLKNGTNCVIRFRVNGHNPLKLDVHSSHINFPLGTIKRSTSRSMQILQINASATRCE